MIYIIGIIIWTVTTLVAHLYDNSTVFWAAMITTNVWIVGLHLSRKI